MNLNNELEACKAFYLKREREILERCADQVAEAGRSKLKYDELLDQLEQLFHHMEYDGMHRIMTIREDKLNLVGFKVIKGKVQR